MTKGKGNKKKKGTEAGKSVSDYKSSSKGSTNQSSIAAFAPKQATKSGKK